MGHLANCRWWCKQCKLHQFTQPKHLKYQQLGHKVVFSDFSTTWSGPNVWSQTNEGSLFLFNRNQINRGMFRKRLEILDLQLRHTYYPLGTSTSSCGTLCKHCGWCTYLRDWAWLFSRGLRVFNHCSGFIPVQFRRQNLPNLTPRICTSHHTWHKDRQFPGSVFGYQSWGKMGATNTFSNPFLYHPVSNNWEQNGRCIGIALVVAIITNNWTAPIRW